MRRIISTGARVRAEGSIGRLRCLTKVHMHQAGIRQVEAIVVAGKRDPMVGTDEEKGGDCRDAPQHAEPRAQRADPSPGTRGTAIAA